MNRKSSVRWLRPLLGTASTSLLICTLAVPAKAEVTETTAETIPPEAESLATASEPTEEISESALPKSRDLPAIDQKEITDSLQPIATTDLPSPADLPAQEIEARLDAAEPDAAEPDLTVSEAALPVLTDETAEVMSTPTETTPDATASDLVPAEADLSIVAQRSSEPQPAPTSQQASDLVGEPLVRVQGAVVVQDEETSARARLTAEYAFSPNVLIGTTIDLTTGDAFVDSESEGFNVNELYVAASPEGLPGLRLIAGMVDLTSYFDRNSFAKDGVTHFFNPVFQTNPALAATGIGSRPSALVIWQVNDSIELKAATFSSSRNLDEFAFDGFAGELGVRLGDVIVRGTFSSDRDDGQDDGFREIFGFDRGAGNFGLESDDREQAYGINAEWWIPDANLGLFGRYGRYENLELDRGGDTFSFGFNLLDLFRPDDRLGLAYGRQLSNNELRQDEGADLPDVLELFYDARITPYLRAGVSLQQRDAFSETVLGLRIRADFDLLGGR